MYSNEIICSYSLRIAEMPHNDDDDASSWLWLSQLANLTWLRFDCGVGGLITRSFDDTERRIESERERETDRESTCKQLGRAQGCAPAAASTAQDFSYAIITIIIILLWKETKEETRNQLYDDDDDDDVAPCPKVVAGKNQLGNTRQKGADTHTQTQPRQARAGAGAGSVCRATFSALYDVVLIDALRFARLLHCVRPSGCGWVLQQDRGRGEQG